MNRLSVHLQERFRRFLPDVVFVMFGINDCVSGETGHVGFKHEMQELVNMIRSQKSIPVLMPGSARGVQQD